MSVDRRNWKPLAPVFKGAMVAFGFMRDSCLFH